MAQTAPRAPRRLPRRDALRLLAASTGAVAGSSLIVSGQAHAAHSMACGFSFSGSPVVAISAFNTTIIGDFITLSMSTIPGSCACGGSATFEYAFDLTTPLTTASSGPWSPSGTVSLAFANLWPRAGGLFTVSAGVRVTCTSPSETTVTCRYATAEFFMPPSFGRVGTNFALASDPGDPGSLPACETAALRFAALAAGPRLMPGAAPTPPELQALIDGAPEPEPLDPLAQPAQPAAEPTPTTTTSPEPTTGVTPTSTPATPASTTVPDGAGGSGASTTTSSTTTSSTTVPGD